MTDLITRADVERLLPHCLRIWPIIQQHPPGSVGRTAITHELDSLPATDRHICDLLLDRMERVIRFRDAWFSFYQGELDTDTPPVRAKRVLLIGTTLKQAWQQATRARQRAFARVSDENNQRRQDSQGSPAQAPGRRWRFPPASTNNWKPYAMPDPVNPTAQTSISIATLCIIFY